ncbi:hypothetical protein COBT_002609, partial [Conglomerata obtusa]
PQHTHAQSSPSGGTTNTQHDLASAVAATKNFGGDDKDDVLAWEKEVDMFIELFNLDENHRKKFIVCKLKGKAQTWVANILKEAPWSDSKTLLAKLKQQFSNTDINHQKLNSFLQQKEANSKIDFLKMLELADDLYQRNAIQEQSLIKLTIARSPIAIRSLLVKYAYTDGEWYNFLREAKENSWLAFSNEHTAANEEIINTET